MYVVVRKNKIDSGKAKKTTYLLNKLSTVECKFKNNT